MRTLHTSYRVSNLAASLDFYTALGYEQVGRVDLAANASLTMLKFPGEDLSFQPWSVSSTIEAAILAYATFGKCLQLSVGILPCP